MPSRFRFPLALLVALALHLLVLSRVNFKKEMPLPRHQDITLQFISPKAPPVTPHEPEVPVSRPPSTPPKPRVSTPPRHQEMRKPPPKVSEPPVRKPPPVPPQPLEAPRDVRPPVITRGLLSQQIAEVTAGITREKTRDQGQKKIIYASAVKENRAAVAAYEAAWHEKVERVGNLNFPEAARREKLSGVLVMAVGIRPDGSLYSAQVQKSSGHPVLDQAAREIVHMAAPFAPLPSDILSEVDILVITRTWRFDGQYRLETRSAE